MLNRLENQGHSSPPSLHWQRHTFANNLTEVGVSLEKVASLLGHESLNMTKVNATPLHETYRERWGS